MKRTSFGKKALASGLRTLLMLLVLAAMLTPLVLVPVNAQGRQNQAAADEIEDYASYSDEELLSVAQKAEKNCRDYSTVSTKKVSLEFPYPAERLDEGLRLQVKFTKNGAIYIMPKPKTGNGVLGVIKAGTKVTVIAEYKKFYFFVADDGRMGWNSKDYFEKIANNRNDVAHLPVDDELDLYLEETLLEMAQEAERNSRDYSTVSTKNYDLELPYPDDYLGTWPVMKIKFTKEGAIYIQPKPKTGCGVLGVITAGTEVVVIAEYKNYYFFIDDYGRMGWAGKSYFVK